MLADVMPSYVKRTRYRDENNSGLIIEFHTSGRKTFRVYKRLKGQKSPINVTIGTFPDLTVEKAQIKARSILNQVADKINPNQKAKVDQQLQKSLEAVFKDYMEESSLKDKTILGYNQVVDCYLNDWKQIPIVQIRESMILNRHKHISKTSSAQANYTMRVLGAKSII